MASINMDGQQSSLLNDVKAQLKRGGNVTHILNVKVSRPPDNETGIAIRQSVFKRIANRPICHSVRGIPVTVKWRTSATSSGAFYHADVPMFTDIVVKEHTKRLLRTILDQIDQQFHHIFKQGRTVLAFRVTRPLMREVAIEDEDDIGEHDEDADDIGEHDADADEVNDLVERF